MIATFLADPAVGEVSRRTAYIRNNGDERACRLHDPLEPLRSPRLPGAAQRPSVRRAQPEEQTRGAGGRSSHPDPAAGFGCRCHGGAYDTEGNRTGGPPFARSTATVRHRWVALFLGEPFSVGDVEGEGAKATITATGSQAQAITWTASRLPLSIEAEQWPTTVRTLADRGGGCSPVDWLEERSGLVGGIKCFLFPEGAARRQLDADARLGHSDGLPRQTVTGVILALYYKPGPDEAYGSDRLHHGRLDAQRAVVRGMRNWGASVFIILMFLHGARVPVRAY